MKRNQGELDIIRYIQTDANKGKLKRIMQNGSLMFINFLIHI